MVAAGSTTQRSVPSFRERIRRDARRFDLKPLIDLLVANGYSREDLLFQSAGYPDDGDIAGAHEGASGSIVRAVEFRDPYVFITVNVGLLGDNALLPSYFFELIERSAEPGRFYDFIRFFDHRLITNFLSALYPEDDESAYGDWLLVQTAFFNMLGLRSVSTLQWLVQAFFPELRVRVLRRAFSTPTTSHAFRTGESKLDGTGILGRTYEADDTGFLVELVAEEETDSRGRAWPQIVRERLEQRLIPLIRAHGVRILVRLRVLYHASWVRVDFPFSDEHGYLGYERIRGDAESGHTVVIYRGALE